MNSNESQMNDARLLREKAEKLLEQSREKIAKPASEADIHKLLHELQVHQIELEMQNEELRLANECTEAALKKYTMLYDFAPTGYFTVDSDGIIKDVNFTGSEILGEKRFTLENSNIKYFISDGFKPIFEEFLRKTFSGMNKESCVINLSQNNNKVLKVYIEGVVLSEDHNCLLSVVDITSIEQ